MDTLPFLVREPDADEDTKGVLSTTAGVVLRAIPIDQLRDQLKKMTIGMMDVLKDVKDVGKFKLKEVTIGVEVTASGSVEFIGTAGLAGKGAITLKFGE